MRPFARHLPLVSILAAAAIVMLHAGTAHAGKKRYYFELVEVKAADSAPAAGELVEPIEKQVAKTLVAHPQLVASLDGAPDPKTNPKAFKKWLARKRIAGAYRVNVEVTEFEEELEDKDASLNQEKRLIVRLNLRMFGETMPARVMAFSGDGGSTVKIDVGKKLRPRDRKYAIEQAIELAVNDALASSLAKLARPHDTPKK